jgi:3-oxoacyl-[acyl-carrier protein] reductase
MRPGSDARMRDLSAQASKPAVRRRVLVFGGSGNLGQSVCRRLAQAGCAVAFTYHSAEQTAIRLAEEMPGSRPMRLDLRNVSAIESCVDAAADFLNGIDAVVQCAALGTSPGDPVPADAHQRMSDVSEAGWNELIAVNVRGAFFACRAAARHLQNAGGGNLVLLGSIDGVKALPSPVHYSATKGALVGMTLSLAKELGPQNIRVNLVAPGVLEAGISRTLPPRLLAEYIKHCGLKRVGRFDEVAAVVAWLALRNTYVTGQTILVEGAL